jgi:Holliday junction DNA helicase RuvA
MIGYLSGKIISLKPTRITLDVSGVGYVVNISINTFEKINDKDSANLFIHTNVREDSISLFGFYTESEKEMFELLISVSGIGPKLAISILSGILVDELRHAIMAGDISRIVSIPGIGRKTAERLVLELKSRISSVSSEEEAKIPFSIKNEDIVSADPNVTLEDLIKKALGSLNR